MRNDTMQIIIRRLPGCIRHYEFIMGDKPAGFLDYEKIFGRKAIASMGDHRWLIKRKGFWNQVVEIVADQSPYTKSIVAYNWRRRYSVRAEDGEIYLLKPSAWWKRSWKWYDGRNREIMEIGSNNWSRNNRGLVQINQAPGQSTQWLVLLGWFLILTAEDDAATIAAS